MIEAKRLADYRIFRDLDPGNLAVLARAAQLKDAKEGETIIQEGQPARTFYVMERGNLLVSFADGRALTLHGPGEVVGWSALIHPTKYTGTVICLTDCSFVAFASNELIPMVLRDVEMGKVLLRNVCQRVSNRIPFLPVEEKRALTYER